MRLGKVQQLFDRIDQQVSIVRQIQKNDPDKKKVFDQISKEIQRATGDLQVVQQDIVRCPKKKQKELQEKHARLKDAIQDLSKRLDRKKGKQSDQPKSSRRETTEDLEEKKDKKKKKKRDRERSASPLKTEQPLLVKLNPTVELIDLESAPVQ